MLGAESKPNQLHPVPDALVDTDWLNIVNPHSYEAFASNPFIREIDADLIKLAPRVSRVLDSATGTGAMIEHLMEQGKLARPFQVVGADIDFKALVEARAKFRECQRNIHFVQGSSEQLPFPDSSFQLVVMGNAIHLTDIGKTFHEAYRVSERNGLFLANSAYELTQALPPGTERAWGMWVSLARRSLRESGYDADIPNPVDLRKHSVKDFTKEALAAGFDQVETQFREVKMDRDAVGAIGNYEDFAKGALPGVPVELSTRALVSSVDPLFDRLNKGKTGDQMVEYIPRNWMFLKAYKN